MARSPRKKTLRQQPAFKKLRELLKQPGQRDLLWYHRAGECVHELFPSEGGRRYGQSQMGQITTALGQPETFADSLWKCRNFFTKYERKEVRSLCKPADFQLSWTHIKHLLALDDDDRLKFQQKCNSAKWTSKELHRAIKAYRGHKSEGGKPFERPKSLDAGLRQLVEESKLWIRRHRMVWFDPDSPVISEKGKIENAKQLPELLDEAVESWEDMEFLLESYLPRLRAMQAWLKKQRTRKAEKPTPAKPRKKTSRKRKK